MRRTVGESTRESNGSPPKVRAGSSSIIRGSASGVPVAGSIRGHSVCGRISVFINPIGSTVSTVASWN